jgi:glycosyltransferase involved in cell wall biosynthesis
MTTSNTPPSVQTATLGFSRKNLTSIKGASGNQGAGLDSLGKEDEFAIPTLALAIWSGDQNLQNAFDLKKKKHRKAYLLWLQADGRQLYDPDITLLTGRNIPLANESWRQYLGKSVNSLKLIVGKGLEVLPEKVSGKLWSQLHRRYLHLKSADANPVVVPGADLLRDRQGLDIIGYPKSEFGLGEMTRMMAKGLDSVSIDFSLLDAGDDSHARQKDERFVEHIVSRPDHTASQLVCAPDQTMRALGRHGISQFVDHPLYVSWAWELQKMPKQWSGLADVIDEFWSPTQFVADAIKTISDKPNFVIPPVVEPGKPSLKTREDFDLDNDRFLFFAHFDCRSFMGRKNPFTILKAFRQAFSKRDNSVGLVLKTMNVDKSSSGWIQLLKAIGEDKRVRLINRVIDRPDMLALLSACDAFVSLHRSEGFGFGPAEALYFAKPVIVSDYSGTKDFCNEITAFPVDVKMIDVAKGAYPYSEGQQWADPILEHAVQQMKLVRKDVRSATSVGMHGQKFIKDNYSAKRVGSLIAQRLK